MIADGDTNAPMIERTAATVWALRCATHITDLPEPILLHILSHLDITSVLNSSLVSRQFYRISGTNSLWRSLCEGKGWTSGPNSHTFGSDGAILGRMRAANTSGGYPTAKWKLYYANGVRLMQCYRRGHFKSRMLKLPGVPSHTVSSLPTLQYDGHTFVTIAGGRIIVADMHEPSLNANVRYTLGSERADMTHVDFSAEDDLLAYGSIGGTVHVGSLSDGYPIFTLHGHRDAIQAVRVSRTVIASGARDNTVRLWSPTTGQFRAELPIQERFWALRMHNSQLLVGTANHRNVGPLQLWNMERGTMTRAITGAVRGGGVYDVLFESDAIAVSCGFDGCLRMWDLRLPFQSPCVMCFEDPDDNPMLCVQTACGVAGSAHCTDWRIVTGSRQHGIVRLWDRRMTGVTNSSTGGFRVTRGVGIARGLVCTYYSRGNRTQSSVHSLAMRGGRIFAGLHEGVCVLDFDSGEKDTAPPTFGIRGDIESMSIAAPQ